VYSKAHKRQEAMEVMGWWRSTPVESGKRSNSMRHLLTTATAAEGGGGGGPRRSLLAVAGPAAAFAAKMAAAQGGGAEAGAGAEDENTKADTCPAGLNKLNAVARELESAWFPTLAPVM
jgi:hypothetical protein